jgi:hypothetical protein
MRRSKQTYKRRLHSLTPRAGHGEAVPHDAESGGAHITPLNQSQEPPVTIIRSKKKTYQLRQREAYRRKGEQ